MQEHDRFLTEDVAQVRHGRWECGEENSWFCSECDEEFYLEDGTPQENGYRFCPNCGAIMDGEEK
jgi:DNA-directed RNA polymerase subunit RPC12/RpoP